MNKILMKLILIVFTMYLSGCNSVQVPSKGASSFEELLNETKRIHTTGNTYLADQYMDYSGLKQKQIKEYRERFVELNSRRVDEVSILDYVEYESLVSDGKLSSWKWDVQPDKVIYVKEVSEGDYPSFSATVMGAVEKNGKWYFSRFYRDSQIK